MFPQSTILSSIIFFTAVSFTNSTAAVVAVATQEGGNVVFNFSGSFLTTGLDPLNVMPTTIRAVISPAQGGIGFGSILGADSTRYLLAAAPTGPFGSGDTTFADLTSGSIFGLGSSSGFAELTLPQGYLSGSMIAGSMTFSDSTFESLGLSLGTYGITWPVDAQTDSFTLVVVPEATSTCLVLLTGASMLLFRKRPTPINHRAEQGGPQQTPPAALSAESPVV